MILRPYQTDAVSKVHEAWKDHRSALIVLPTGTGKTIVFSHIAGTVRGRVMVIAHREELIAQAAQKIQVITGDEADVEMGEFWASEGVFSRSRVVVSSVQTQNAGMGGDGRMSRFDPSQFDLLIIDEAHHATAPTYRRLIDHYRQNPNLKVLGVTATPDRADEEALGQVFESVAFDYEIVDAIADGWLVPVRQRAVYVEGLDYSSVRTTAGDLNGADLARILEYEEALHGIAHPTMELVGTRKSLVFAASVAHAERLAEIFNRHRPGSDHASASERAYCRQTLCLVLASVPSCPRIYQSERQGYKPNHEEDIAGYSDEDTLPLHDSPARTAQHRGIFGRDTDEHAAVEGTPG